MSAFPTDQFITDAVIYTVVFTVYVLGSLLWRPRLWLHDFPPDIQALAEPKTDAEKRQTIWLAIPFLALFFGLPIVMMWNFKAQLGADYSIGIVWLYAYLLFVVVNLWDLVAIDWIGVSLIDPQKPPIPGTEGAAGWRDYRFHFIGFIKGCMIGVGFATFASVVIHLFAG